MDNKNIASIGVPDELNKQNEIIVTFDVFDLLGNKVANNETNVNMENIFKFFFSALFTLILILSIPCIIGVLAYSIVNGKNIIKDSKSLVLSVEAIAIDDPFSYTVCSRSCWVMYMTTLNYTFNNETMSAKYNSIHKHLKNDKFNLTVCKSTGVPQQYDQTKLYKKGKYMEDVSTIFLILFIPLGIPLILCILAAFWETCWDVKIIT